MSSSLIYRSDIDGLRAVSVIAVILFHAHIGVPGGFTGVDIFFVISGFLITSLIWKNLESGHYSLADFWERRIRRILPACLTMILTVSILGYAILLPKDLSDLGKSICAQAVMISNVYFWRDTGYFAGPSELKPLLHTWSLAVEEQFYLLLPLILPGLFRFGRRVVTFCLMMAALLSFAMSVYGVIRSPSAAFYLLPTRAWELLVGSLIALMPIGETRRPAREMLSWIGLGLVGFGFFGLSRSSTFPGWNACFPVIGGALLITANHNGPTLIGGLLSTWPFVFVGKISYSLYLWHWPIFVLARYLLDAQPSVPLYAVLIFVSFVVALVSYYLVEEPFRRKRLLLKRPALFAWAGILLATSFGLGMIGWKGEGLAYRVPPSLRQPPTDGIVAPSLDSLRRGELPVIGDRTASQPTFIVWGDSHAGVAVPLFDRWAREFQISGCSAAHGGNPPLPGCMISWNPNLLEWSSLVLGYIQQHKIRHVFLVARWASYVEGASEYDTQNGIFHDEPLVYRKDDKSKSHESSLATLQNSFQDLCRELKTYGCSIHVVVQAPEQEFDPFRQEFMSQRILAGWRYRQFGTNRTDYEKRQKRVMDALRAVGSDVNWIDGSESLFDERDNVILYSENSLTYADNQHLTQKGLSLMIEDSIKRLFASMAHQSSQSVDSVEKPQ